MGLGVLALPEPIHRGHLQITGHLRGVGPEGAELLFQGEKPLGHLLELPEATTNFSQLAPEPLAALGGSAFPIGHGRTRTGEPPQAPVEEIDPAQAGQEASARIQEAARVRFRGAAPDQRQIFPVHAESPGEARRSPHLPIRDRRRIPEEDASTGDLDAHLGLHVAFATAPAPVLPGSPEVPREPERAMEELGKPPTMA